MKSAVSISVFAIVVVAVSCGYGQDAKKDASHKGFDETQFAALQFRNIGPFRGGRSVAAIGHPQDPLTYYFGGTGGGVWKTTDAGVRWQNISDGFFKSGSVGAIAMSPSDPNVIYVGMGEHAVRGVMSSHGDGVYKSTDGGQSWTHVGLPKSSHIAAIRIHPDNSDIAYVAVQGNAYAGSQERGVYQTTDGGKSWKRILFVNETTGAADLSMDANNPRILYAGMWDHLRRPWKVRSGGPGSGIHKSTDGGKTWHKLVAGLPAKLGKVAVDVSAANSNVVYANIEAAKGGVFRSDNGGKSWKQTSSDRVTVARAWYYIEIFADPQDENRVYVLNAPMLRSIDGGKTFQSIPNPHGDQHDLWINPDNPRNMILANDGGACVTFDFGKSWSPQNNQPTAQFYRVIADQQFPYRLYAGQQDNSTVSIASRSLRGTISERNWFPTAGGESAFLAFDPKNPKLVYGTSIQGSIDRHNLKTNLRKSIEVYPQMKLGTLPKDQKHRFNIADLGAETSSAQTRWNELLTENECFSNGLAEVMVPPDLESRLLEQNTEHRPLVADPDGLSKNPGSTGKISVGRIAWVASFAALIVVAIFFVFAFQTQHQSRMRTVALLAVNNHLNHLDDHGVSSDSRDRESLEKELAQQVNFNVALPHFCDDLRLVGGRKCKLGTHTVAFSLWSDGDSEYSLFQFRRNDFGIAKSTRPRLITWMGPAGDRHLRGAWIWTGESAGYVLVGDPNVELSELDIAIKKNE